MATDNVLLSVVLFWALVSIGSTLFGLACIKWGVYTAGNEQYKPTLEA